MKIHDIIAELKSRVGVRGALVTSTDGVLVAQDLCDGLDAEAIAALASGALGTATRSVRMLSLGKLNRITLTARFGRLVFVPMDELVLVVVTEPSLDLEHTLLEIAGPARRIVAASRFDSGE